MAKRPRGSSYKKWHIKSIKLFKNCKGVPHEIQTRDQSIKQALKMAPYHCQDPRKVTDQARALAGAEAPGGGPPFDNYRPFLILLVSIAHYRRPMC